MRGSAWVGLATVVAGLASLISGSQATATQAGARPVVVELFTSEGCSSCPPADALLSELARSRPDVLPLAFHITYWDRLGWPDPYSLTAATDRQRDYAAAMGLDSIYTPQMVVDGHFDVVGSDRSRVLQTVRLAASALKPPVALRLARAGDKIAVEVGDGAGGTAGTLLLVGYDPVHETLVARGENAGRKLSEANIVRGFAQVASWHGARISVQAAAPAGERVAAILQAPDGQVLGAATLE